ncbi:MAG: hypothetical protein NZ942_02380, partial [Candidatus Aenigmarchaeota archaeon]|nr:hypothetical protein [Candidatus Aenigmarchaeota archaeon]
MVEEQQEQKVKISFKIPKINAWAVSTFILAIGIVVVWFFKPTQTGFAVKVLPAEEAGRKAIEYINQNLVEPGNSANLVSIKDMGTFYEIITSYRGSTIP